MAVSVLPTCLVVSIVPPYEQLSGESQEGTGRQAEQLCALLEKHRMVATWGIPLESFLAMPNSLEHELALLGEDAFIASAGRAGFSQHLSRQLSHANANGILIGSIVLTPDAEVRNADLLIKNGMRAIAVRSLGPCRGERPVDQIRWGLWKLRPTTVIRNASGWLPSRLERQVHASIGEHRMVHLQIELAKSAMAGRDLLGIADRVLGQVSDLRAKYRLENISLSALANELALGKKSRSTESILRRVA